MPKIVDRDYVENVYYFLKGGKLYDDLVLDYDFKELKRKHIERYGFPKDTRKYLKSFSFFSKNELGVKANSDSINFKGRLYLLVDEEVFSSSEMMAFFAKESKMMTLIGEKTGGDGIGMDPYMVGLPNTDYAIRFPILFGVTSKGSINEKDKTTPDIIVENPRKNIRHSPDGKLLFDGDDCILEVLNKEKVELILND